MSYVNEALDELYADYFDSAYVEDGTFYNSAEEDWDDEHLKVLFVLKQPSNSDLLGEDYRSYDFDTLMESSVWQELLARLYGIMNTDEDGYPDYDEATDWDNMREAFYNYPFAAINIIKDECSSSTSPSYLKRYARNNRDFLTDQLNILQPDIIVCCGRDIFDIVNSAYSGIRSNNNYLKYDSDLDVIYFDTCHPSHRGGYDALEHAYDCMLSEYSDFLED